MGDPTIVALGGGGFSQEESPLLDDFVLSLAAVEEPRICFLAQASGDSSDYVRRFYDAFTKKPCRPSHLSLFTMPNREPREHLLAQDVVYVGGGSTPNMLAVWRVHRIDEILGEAWQSGVLLAGISAGANCWFEHYVTDAFGEELEGAEGLGFLPGTFCPHYDGEPKRRPGFARLVRNGLPDGLACEDGVAAVYDGRELREAVSSRPDGRAFRVGAAGEEAIEARYLA
jgi:dipeptidase E